ncbi:hypothetical protein BJY01DRAFT_256598, partial [Aspergillus pseudoustus]
MHLSITFLAVLAATASALHCVSPPAPNPIDLCNPWTVRWETSPDDPPQFCVYLSNYQLSNGAAPHAVQVAGPINRGVTHVDIPGR